MKRNNKKIVENKNSKSCVCEIHIRMDKERTSAIPCIGHGKDCPCTILLEETKKNDKKEQNVEATSL